MVNIWTLKLEIPPDFEGQYNIKKVESWVYQIKNNLILANVQNENLKARYATLLLTKNTAIWMHARGYDLKTLGNS